jgi:hypothetical protein
MEPPKEVRITRVAHGFEFTDTGQPVKVTNITYMVATHGPFVLKVYAGQDTPDFINRTLSEAVEKLRGIGALPNPTA